MHVAWAQSKASVTIGAWGSALTGDTHFNPGYGAVCAVQRPERSQLRSWMASYRAAVYRAAVYQSRIELSI